MWGGWLLKASVLMQGTAIHAAFVSTNSITQGEQAAGVWKPLFERFGIHIDFAWRTFRWDSESTEKAHVHCVIVGFSADTAKRTRYIYDGNIVKEAQNINPYLMDAPTVFITARSAPLSKAPVMGNGGKPAEGGYLILTIEEKEDYLKKEPQGEKFLRPYMMGKDFIYRKPRYCFWLVNANPAELRKCPILLERIEKVRQFRLASKKAATQKKAATPSLFDEVRECTSSYIALAKVSSENRRYIPMDYLPPEIITGDSLFMVPDVSKYEFGVLISNVHMAWMRAVAGRLEMRYRYSNTVVYNNFPWPEPTEAQRAAIERTAQGILDARAKYPEASLADLYDELTMPPELRRSHQENDKAVMTAYGWNWRGMTETDCVAELMRLYQRLADRVEK